MARQHTLKSRVCLSLPLTVTLRITLKKNKKTGSSKRYMILIYSSRSLWPSPIPHDVLPEASMTFFIKQKWCASHCSQTPSLGGVLLDLKKEWRLRWVSLIDSRFMSDFIPFGFFHQSSLYRRILLLFASC